MPKVAFIDPEAALGALTPKEVPEAELDLGPSPPHAFEDEPEEEPEPVVVAKLQPILGSGPGQPAQVGEMHYTNMLDEIWPEFDDPEERTAARLGSLLDEVADEAQRVGLLAQDLWAKWPKYKLPDSERARWDKEFLAYLRRLNIYRGRLEELEPQDTATDAVYVGLVKRRLGAGPVPDCIMHMYFAQQLGILADHVEDMSEGFVGRVLDALAAVDRLVDDAQDAVEAEQAAAQEWFEEWAADFKRPFIWAGGILLGSMVAIGGTVAVIVATRGSKK